MKKRLKINGFIMSVAALAVIIFPALFFRKGHNDLSEGLAEITGVAFILFGQLLRVSARGYKSEHSDNGRSLIQGGPYTLVRNPMYLGILLIGLGVVAMLFKWWVAGIFLLTFIIRYQLLIFKEEKKLADLFPGAYQDYQRSVPRILPSISMIARNDLAGYLPLKIPWIKKEIGAMLAVSLPAIILESWEDIQNAGIKTYFKEALGISAVIILFILLVVYLNRRTHNGVSDKS